MMKRLLLLAAIGVCPAWQAYGESLVALTVGNQLLRFDSATPGTIVNATMISGLAAGDQLAGIDLRPANSVLYGFAVDSGPGGANAGVGRVYAIDPDTGAATLAATLAADPADGTAPAPFTSVTGDFFGVDFNPVADRLRVVSDGGLNLRINVSNGLTQLDGPLAYAVGDSNAGSPPAAVASAYANNVAGATSTTLFNLDANISVLATQSPPNDGTLNSVGLTGAGVTADSAFDISGLTGVGYAVLDGLTLVTVNLANGELSELGPINTQGSILGLAALAVIPEPATGLSASVAAACLLMARARRRAGTP